MINILEKERREIEKEEARKRKEEQRQLDLKKREDMKVHDLQKRRIARVNYKARKDEEKKNDKARLQIRKEVMSEVRKLRTEINSAVIRAFDAEEMSCDITSTSLDNGAITAMLESLPEATSDLSAMIYEAGLPMIPLLDSSESNNRSHKFLHNPTWDEVFYSLNGVNLIRPVLYLDKSIYLEDFLRGLLKNEFEGTCCSCSHQILFFNFGLNDCINVL